MDFLRIEVATRFKQLSKDVTCKYSSCSRWIIWTICNRVLLASSVSIHGERRRIIREKSFQTL